MFTYILRINKINSINTSIQVISSINKYLSDFRQLQTPWMREISISSREQHMIKQAWNIQGRPIRRESCINNSRIFYSLYFPHIITSFLLCVDLKQIDDEIYPKTRWVYSGRTENCNLASAIMVSHGKYWEPPLLVSWL